MALDRVISQKGAIKVLGVEFNEDLLRNESWDECERRIEKRTHFWKLRNLSYTGKVLVIKAVIIPIVLSVPSVFPIKKRRNV